MTASSIFKAFLPSEARATNCTSQAGQDGIHRTALPLISPPSAANQTHHMAAFCLLTAARARKVNSCSTKLDRKSSGMTGPFSVSFFLFVCGQIISAQTRIEPQQAITLSRIHLSLLTVTGTAEQQFFCFFVFFFFFFLLFFCS